MVSFTNADIRKFDPFFVGVDRLWRHMDDLNRMAATPVSNFPPYNIRKESDNDYSIEMAVAGFTEKDIDVTLEDRKLTVTGKVENEEEGERLLHRGIANRAFKREFTLADTIEVEGADLQHGMLKITLKNIVPDSKKPKQIPITSGSKLLEGKTEKQLLVE